MEYISKTGIQQSDDVLPTGSFLHQEA